MKVLLQHKLLKTKKAETPFCYFYVHLYIDMWMKILDQYEQTFGILKL